jgi:hypothetical protein
MQANWRRGLLRVWLLLSAAWIMGWVVYLIIYGIRAGFQSSGDLLAIPNQSGGAPLSTHEKGRTRWLIRRPKSTRQPEALGRLAVRVRVPKLAHHE